MSKEIKAIDRGAVHRICSGQVVLNLAVAVKELVENSIDAGAKNISVKLKDYGSKLVEVVDDGEGVDEPNFAGLALKYHTSKLREFSDLEDVATFGFRGEALSSLCALCDVTVSTCHKDATQGTLLKFDHNGVIISKSPCARERGTTVSLHNLFSTLPVRHREFLSNLKREFGRMVSLLTGYCLIVTGVNISCANFTEGGRKQVVLNSQGSQAVRERIATVYGAKEVTKLLDIQQHAPTEDILEEFALTRLSAEPPSIRIEGYISSCAHGSGRSSCDRQFVFVNSRPCEMAKLTKLVNSVYHTFNRDQYPFLLINIHLERQSVDVNVTPDKRSVFVHHEKYLLAIVKSSLVAMFQPIAATYERRDFSSSPSLSQPLQSPIHSYLSPRLQNLSPANKGEDPLSTPVKRRSSALGAASSSTLSPSLQNFKFRRIGSSSHRVGTSSADDSPLSCSQSTVSVSCSQGSSTAESESLEPLNSGEEMASEEICSGSWSSSPGTGTAPNQVEELASSDSLVQFRAAERGDGSASPASEKKGLSRDCLVTPRSAFGSGNSGTRDVSSQIHSTTHRTNLCPSKPGGKKSGPVGTCSLDRFRYGTSTSGAELVAVHEVSSRDCEDGLADTASSGSERGSERSEVLYVGGLGKDDGLCGVESQPTLQCEEVEVDEHAKGYRKTQPFRFSSQSLAQHLRDRQRSMPDQSSSSEKCRSFRAAITPGDNATAEKELSKQISKDMFAKMEVIGQFNLGFIISQLGEDLFIVDQHAADEKYNFETLQREVVMETQRLLMPQTLELTAVNEMVLTENLEIFKKNGFDFEMDESQLPGRRVRLVSIPVSGSWQFGKEDVDELIFMLSDNPHTVCRPSKLRQMFASRACRKSVMVGTALTVPAMKKVLGHLGELDHPWNCPHGRPTMRHLVNLSILPD